MSYSDRRLEKWLVFPLVKDVSFSDNVRADQSAGPVFQWPFHTHTCSINTYDVYILYWTHRHEIVYSPCPILTKTKKISIFYSGPEGQNTTTLDIFNVMTAKERNRHFFGDTWLTGNLKRTFRGE